MSTETVLDYHSPSPTFALAFSPLSTTTASIKLAIGSHVESRDARPDTNHITIIGLDKSYLEFEDDFMDGNSDNELGARGMSGKGPSRSAFIPLARAPHSYPPSAIAFSPSQLAGTLQSSNSGTAGDGGSREMVASSSDCLRLWDFVGDAEIGGNGFVGERGRKEMGSPSRLVQRAMLANSKTDYSAPITSFSWSTLEPTNIVTSSIDTTCTVWDIATSIPITQLIAHDREVYDVAWSPATRDVFASVGADGSVRMFDLRALEHSTILYEATSPPPAPSNSSVSPTKNGSTFSPSSGIASSTPLPTPLLRLAFSPTSPTYLSVCHADSGLVQILDTRSPGTPMMEVRGHKAAVNGMAWGGSTMHGGGGETSGPGWLATCSPADDSTLLLWDLTSSPPVPPQPSRSIPPSAKVIQDPVLAYTAPSEINAVAWGCRGEWVAAGCGRLVRLLRV